MQSLKPVNCLLRMASCAALLLSASTALAGRYWVAADGSTGYWNDTANWSAQKDGTSGASVPNTAESTGTIYFCKYKNGATVFDILGEGPGNVQIGTQDERYFVWSATDAAYGLDATGKELQICQNISNSARSPAKLQIDSGTYKFGKVFVSYIAKGTAELLLKGGTVTTTASGADILGVCMSASGLETTTGKLTIDGGALDCTSGDFFSVGGRSNTTATVHIKSGSLTAKGFLLGGRGGHKSLREVDNAVATMILDGGTLTTSGECAIGDSYGSGTTTEMIINPGATYNCNYGYFYVAEAGPGTLTMNGGTFTMIGSSDGKGGLSLGRCKNGNDVATIMLNGGTLTTERFRLDYVQPGSKITFNGTSIKPTRTITSFLNTSDNLECVIKDGGLVVDTDGYDITIEHAFVDEDGTAAASSTKIGTITKKGKGKLTLSEAFPADKIIVQKGTVSANGTTYEATNETSNQSRYWLGATQDTLVSDTANWASAEGGAAGASSIDTDYLGKVYFPGGYTTGAAVFDSAVELANAVSVGAATATPLVWSATVAANGFDNATGDMILGYDASHATANLKIDSGTYSSSYLRLGYTDNADAELVMNGGSVTMAKGRVGGGANGAKGTLAITNGTVTATGELYVLAGNKTGGNGELVVNGGTLVTTAPDYVRVGETGQNATGTLHMVSGTWNTKSFLVGGAKKKTANSYSGMGAFLVVDGGTINASADCSIGANVAADARSEMIINNGNVNINANVLYVGDGGPGYLTINGGNLTMKDSDYGVSLGHIKGDGTGGDPGIVTLNGGTLTLPKFRLDYVAPGSKIVFNGGTLVATRTQTDFLNATDSLTCEIQSGNLIIDTAGYDVTIAHDLTGVGGVIKKGLGALHLTGNNTFTGEISVQAGTVDDLAIDNDPASYTTALGVTEDGQDLGTVQLHRSPLSLWLADEDFETYTSTYGAKGTESKETPRYIAVGANGVTNTYINLNTASNVTGTVDGKAYSFTTEDVAPRTLRLDYSSSGYAANVRDVGSWPLQSTSGKKMNQDVILRGGNLDGFATASSSYKTDGYLTKIGLKTEIDLRRPSLDTGMADGYKNLATDGTASSFAAENCTYYRFDLGWGTSAGTQIGADDNGNFTNQIRKVFSTWGTPGNLPSYFHCQIGTDRTGVTGLLLLGLMGVEEEVLYRDYLMSNFANIGESRSSEIPEQFIKYILRGDCNSGKYAYTSNDATYGRSIASRVRQYLEMCGVTSEEIGVITAALSGETPAEVLARVDAYETANNYRTVSYVSYEGSSTTNAIHRFGTNGKRILPRSTPTRDGYTFLGWDVDNESVYDEATGDSVVYALWKADVVEPQKYKWDNNAGDFNLANGGNWYVSGSDPKVYGVPTIIDECEVSADDSRLVLTNGETFAAAKLEFTNGSSTRYPVLDITNGTFTVDGNFNLGYWGHRGEANVFGGVVDVKNLIVGDWGSREYNKFNVYGGNVTIRNSFKIGTNVDARGDVSILGGTVTSLASVSMGDGNLSAVGGPESSYKSTLNVGGGELSVTGSVNVATATCGGAVLNLSNGDVAISEDLNIASGSNSWAQVDVLAGGSLTVGGTIRVGNNTYAQHAVLNVAGGTVDVKSLSVARECDGYVYVTDGGTIYAESIDKAQGAPSTAHPYFYFDDANIVAKSGYAYTFASSSGITLGAGGLTFDTNGYSPTIQAFTAIDGIGGLTKKGEGKLELVANSFGFAGAYNAHGVISVEKGTLKMPAGQTFYVEGTDVAEGATLDLNGSTLVIVTKSIEDATWTNATGDRDAANPANWSTTVKYYGEDGKEIEAIRVTLDGVLPAVTSDVRIPIDSDYPTNLDPASVKSVTYVSSRDMSLILDFAATYDNYAAPSIALSGDVKILSNFNALLNSAAAWYDPSDASTLATNEEGVVSAIANKGHLGVAMNGNAYDPNSRPYIGDDGWLNFSNCFGFVSANNLPLTGDRGRSLFSVNNRADLWETDAEKQIFPISMGDDSQWTPERRYFSIECWSWTINNYFVLSSGNIDDVGVDGNTEGTAYVRSLVAAGGVINAGTVDYNEGALRTRNGSKEYDGLISGVSAYVYYGMRRLYGTTSLGKVGEVLAFDYGLSTTASAAVRQYLAAKWLEGDAVAPSAGTTVFDELILEGANVDMDGAAVSVGVLGGYGSITNCASLRITDGFACDVDGEGNAPKIVAQCDVDVTDATVAELSDALADIVNTGTVVPLVETTGKVTMPSRLKFKHGARDYVIYKVVSGDKTMICLAKDLGFSIRLR